MARLRRFWIAAGFGLAFLVGALATAALLAPRSGRGVRSGERIGVLEIEGLIADSRFAVEALRDFRSDRDVKAVVVRVDSPGGVVAPSQEIHDEVARTAKVKPVVVSMGTVAASGGYYLSAPATRIVANPGTATGSIGVILKFQDVHLLLQKLGVGVQVLKSGPYKDSGSPFREMSAGERKLFQGLVDDIYAQFVDAVAAGRKMDRGRVLALADGRVCSGRQALGLGLVDQLGSFWDAVGVAQQLGKLSGEPRLEYREPKSGSLLRFVLGESARGVASLAPEAGPLRYAVPGW